MIRTGDKIGGDLAAAASRSMRLLQRCLVLLAAGLLSACPTASVEGEGAGSAKPLRVLASDFAPFYHLDERGRAAGFEHRILESFAQTHGRDLQVVWVEDFGAILDALLAGDGDVIASTLTITEERRKRVDFSAPYFPVRVVLVERQGADSQGLDSMRGKKVATIRGTTYEHALEELPEVEILYATTEREMYEMVATERADALASDTTNYLWVGRDYPQLTVTASLSDRSFYGFAVRPGDPLKGQLDAHIETIRRDGSYARFLRDAFGPIAAGFLDRLGDLESDFLPPLAADPSPPGGVSFGQPPTARTPGAQRHSTPARAGVEVTTG